MTIISEEISKRIKGTLNQTEDWWHLCLDTETGRFFVRHDWDHVALNSLSQDVGSDEHAVETWRGPGADTIEAAKQRLLEQANT